jgi:hypothetical protein
MMNKLILFLAVFFFNISFSQPINAGIEIRLVNEAYSLDPGLIAILNSHSVAIYQEKGGHPYPEFQSRIYQTEGADNLSALLADLLNYSSVVESAVIADASAFSDCCKLQLLNANIGIPVGLSGNNVVTNDTQLNAIFQNYNVYYDVQTYPNSTWESTLRWYSLVCNCDVQQLRDALDAYTGGIEATELESAAYLHVNNYIQRSVKIYPNPFKTDFEIDSVDDIANYYLADISGKLITNTYDFLSLQSQLQNLRSGVYFLTLKFAVGFSETRKVVKL